MSLTPAFLDELRARTTLSTLIGRSVKLQKAGREYRACCPFHQEKSPSFYVNDDKGFYHCFGCSAHGDAIRWMTDQQGLPFIDAVKELAAAAGLEVPAADPRSAERAEAARGLHDVMADAAQWFTEQLNGLSGGEARALLEKRGVKPETARAFGLGFAPDSRGKLKDALKAAGDDMLVEAGLLIRHEDKPPYDRFRGRLMIPIRDPRGRTIAFGGRVIGEGEPKYLNSPDTPLFDKGRTLYNLDRAAAASRKSGRVIVVEGYMDVIALAQTGFEEAVAPLGTALTEAQLERLWKLADVPILCFDGDAAGQKAALRAAHRALPMLAPKQSLTFAVLPADQDPDDLIRTDGPAAFESVITSARPLIRVIYEGEKEQSATSTPEGRAGLRHSILQLSEQIGSKFVQAEYRRSLNDFFFEEFGWKRGERRVIGQAVVTSGPHGKPALLRAYIRSALYGLARFPSVLSLALEHLSSLEIKQEELLPWRETMIEAVIARPGLDDDALKAILEASKLKPQTREDLKFDLRFPWNVDPSQAVRTLGGMVEFLHEEQELLAEIDAVGRSVHGDLTSTEYLMLDRRRAALYEAKAALYERGYQLGVTETESDTE